MDDFAATIHAFSIDAKKPEPTRVLDADAALNAAIADMQAGRAAAARATLRQFDDAPPADALRCNLIGLLHLGDRAAGKALVWFERALAVEPTRIDTVANRAVALLNLARLPEALAAFDRALQLGTAEPSVLYNRGHVLRGLNRLEEALASYEAALLMAPAYTEASRAAALCLRDLGRDSAAVSHLETALRQQPSFAAARLDLGALLQGLGCFEEAIALYEAGLLHEGRRDDLLNNLGVALQLHGRLADALARLDEAIAVAPLLPEAQFNRGNVLLQMQRPDEALAAFDAALRLRPGYTEALCSRAVALKYCERMGEALAAFDVALAQDPNSAHAKNNKAALLLLHGDFARGLDDYEFRWIAAKTPKHALVHPIPEWTGRSRPGERVLVFDEQGLGDVLQFCRYLPLMVHGGARVTFMCRPKMHRLLRSLNAPIRLIEAPEAGESFDSQIALSSLPRAFGTRLDTIPAATPYVHAEEPLVAAWTRRIGTQGIRVGVCWHGNPDPKADPSRSVPLSLFAPLAAVPDVRLIAIQKVDGLDSPSMAPGGLRIETPGAPFDDGPDAFVDTAAIMQSLDLIVTCDTSISHLAGALGRPVWVLLKRVPDWRWLLERRDSPWYPTMRLFRQARRGDWAEVVARLAASLQAARVAAKM